jgi:hypothetical protein
VSESKRASLGVKVWKSYQEWSVQRSAVRSIAWLDEFHECGRRIKPAVGLGGCDIVNVTGSSISRHLPGFHRHRRKDKIALLSNVAKPVDLITVTLITLPLFRFSVTLNRPVP